MCGIAGYFSIKDDVNENILKKMAETLIHRGPNYQGTWIDNDDKNSIIFLFQFFIFKTTLTAYRL